jgi:hypothetical protein
MSLTAERHDDAQHPSAPVRPRAVRVPAIVRDVLLVVLGAALALAVDEWRDARQRAERVRVALAGIRDELRANARRVDTARARHRRVADTLGALAARGVRPTPQVWTNPMFNPALVTSTAWQAARETGALADMPLATVLRLARAYEAQERYRALGRRSSSESCTMSGGTEWRACSATTLASSFPSRCDFGNRESVLLEHYHRALAAPAALSGRDDR